jgi:shikimate dehydrogenase
MKCVRISPGAGGEWDAPKLSGADYIEVPLDSFGGIPAGKLWLLASRYGVPVIATFDGEVRSQESAKLLERAIQAHFDLIEIPLEMDVEVRARLAALARKSGVKVVISQRMSRPPVSAEELVRSFRKGSDAGAEVLKLSLPLAKARELRMLMDALRMSKGTCTRFLAAGGPLSTLASLAPADIVYGGINDQEPLALDILSKRGERTRLFALLGTPPHHTLMLEMLNAGFGALGADCIAVPVMPEPSDLGDTITLLGEMGFEGLVAGVPFREEMRKHVSTERGQAQGPVSAAVMRNGKLDGHDTVGPAVLAALDAVGIRLRRRKALVLGSGGGAHAAASALVSGGAGVSIAARRLKKALALASLAGCRAAPLDKVPSILKGTNLVVSAVPAYSSIVPANLLRREMVVVDLVCEPKETPLLEAARKAGAMAVPGTAVLVHHAAGALKLFTGTRPPLNVLEKMVETE